jgi:AcrR family transcriptional regulator
MTEPAPVPSARRDELLGLAYRYVTRNGLAELSLRPLAAAVGSSPRVLLFLFGSKDDLLRALLGRARQDQLDLLAQVRAESAPADLAAAVRGLWRWLAAPAHRSLLGLWLEAYTQSLRQPGGPWDGFARQTVTDWLAELARAQTPARRRSAAGAAERTLALAVLRGSLLDLLATGDHERTTAALEHHLSGESRPGQVDAGISGR